MQINLISSTVKCEFNKKGRFVCVRRSQFTLSPVEDYVRKKGNIFICSEAEIYWVSLLRREYDGKFGGEPLLFFMRVSSAWK